MSDKTVLDIENDIDTEFETKFGFDINTTSNVGDFKLLRGVVAAALYVAYKFFALFKIEIALIAQSTEFANDRWWLSKSLAFQYGDSISEKDGILYYAVIDETKQIIKRVAIVEALIGGIKVVQIKVAKLDGSNSVPLSGPEKTAFTFYIEDIKPSGIDTNIVSIEADEVKVIETIYFDGKLDPAAFATTMMVARKAYLAGIVFNGQFNLNVYRDALEAVCGAGNADVQSVQIKPHGGVYSAVGRVYNPVSGHYKLIEADCLITYIPA